MFKQKGPFGVAALLMLAACNPLGQDMSSSVIDAGFHPGYVSRVIHFDETPSLMRGGEKIRLAFELPDEIQSAQLEYTADGITYSVISSLSVFQTSYDWTVPTDDTVLGQLKLSVVNRQGVASSLISSVFSIDSIAPSAPSATLQSASQSNSASVALTIADCTDRQGIFVSESSTAPLASATGWMTCQTAVGVIHYSVASADGAKTLYVYAKDEAGNISSSSSVNVTIDRTAPILTWVTAPAMVSMLKGGGSYSLSWTATEATTSIQSLKLYYAGDGASYDAGTSLSTSATSLSWTIPTDDVSTAKLKLVAVDAVGNTQSIVAGPFTIDSSLPTVSITDLSGPYRGGTSVNISLSASDTLSGLNTFKLQYASNGTTFTDVATLSNSATSHSWTVPSDNTSAAKLKVIAIDVAGNENEATTSAFTIDSTAPSAPTISLTSGNPTNSTAASLTVSSCSDRSKIYVSETSTAPAFDAAGWQTCSTGAGAITSTLSSTDGSKTLYVFAQDAVGNVSTASSTTVTLDRTAPTIALSSFTGGEIVSGLLAQSIEWSASDSGSGLKTNSAKIEVSSDSGASWSTLASNQTTAGPYSWSAGSSANGTHYRIQVTVSDAAGNTASASSPADFTMDSEAPTMTSGSLTVNGSTSNPSVTNNNVKIALQASDTQTKITSFCVKFGSTVQPDESDVCWHSVSEPGIDLTPALTLDLVDFSFSLGFASSTYVISAWVQDEAKNVSTVSSVSATYLKPEAITLTSLMSIANESPTLPLGSSDLNLLQSAPLYIKWKSHIPTDNSIQSIHVEYLTDESSANWTDSGATGLVDGNNGCAPDGAGDSDDGFTGCYLWQAPVAGYFKVRVIVEDQYGSVRIATAQPNNTTPFEMLAGNLDMSLDGDPKGVILQYVSSDQQGTSGSLAVSKEGTIYFHDTTRGILKFDPGTNSIEQLFPQGGTAAAYDDEARSNVTLQAPGYIDLDAGGKLYIFDKQYIHRWNPATDKVTTIVGGGTQNGLTVEGGRNLKITSQTPAGYLWFNNVFTVMPNGDILFRSDYTGTNYTKPQNWSLRYYKAGEDKVYTLKINSANGTYSTSSSFDPSECYLTHFAFSYDVNTLAFTHLEYRLFQSNTDNAACGLGSFVAASAQLLVPSSLLDDDGVTLQNANTAVADQPPTMGLQGHLYRTFTGKDGRIYMIEANGSHLYRYSNSTNAYTRIYGPSSSIKGTCDDGTLATNCQSKLSDAFVTREGRVYVVDRGQIRFIDEDGKVQTILGQSPLYNGSVLTARFGTINNLRFSPSTHELVFADNGNQRVKRMTIGGTVTDVIGTSGIPLSISSTNVRSSTFDFYPGTSDLIYNALGSGTLTQVLSRQDSSTQAWSTLTGSTSGIKVVDADGEVGANIDFSDDRYSSNGIIRSINDHLLIDFAGSAGAYYDHVLKAYDLLDSFRQGHLLGVSGTTVGTTCSGENVDSSTCAYGLKVNYYLPEAAYDSDDDAYLVPDVTSNKILKLGIGVGATKSTWLNFRQTVRSVAIDYAGHRVYYCASDGSNWRIYDFDTSTTAPSTAPVGTAVVGWPVDYDCIGNSLVIDDTTGSRRVIFPVVLKSSSAVQGIGAMGNLP